MRQFLNKTTCETKWFDGIPKGPEWVEIPNGAKLLTKDLGGYLTFWNGDLSMNVGDDNNWRNPEKDDVMDFKEYEKYGYTVLWEKEDMKLKEYLVKDKQTGKYYVDNNPANYDEAIEIPEGAEYFFVKPTCKYFTKFDGNTHNQFYVESENAEQRIWLKGSMKTLEVQMPYLKWQRQPENSNPLFDVNWFEGDLKEKKHNHYFKNVKHLDYVDVYRVLDLFEVVDPCIQHAIKKLLCAGMRGAKNQPQDVQEAIDSLIRYQEMRKEDRK